MSSLTLTTNNQASVYLHKSLSSTANPQTTTNSQSKTNALQPTTSNLNSRNQSSTSLNLNRVSASAAKGLPNSPSTLEASRLTPSFGSPTLTSNPTSPQRTSLGSNRSNLTMNRNSSSFVRSASGNLPMSSSVGMGQSIISPGSDQILTPIMHSEAVPNTLLNSAFLYSTNNARRNSIQNSPLLSQPSSLNSSSVLLETVDNSPQIDQQSVGGTGLGQPLPYSYGRHSMTSIGGGKVPYDRSSSTGTTDYTRSLEEENALMCEELQATVVELSEARELARQFALQKDQGEARLQSILHCIYEQNTVLDQCCGQMDFLRALVDESGVPKMERKSKSVDSDSFTGADRESNHPNSSGALALDGSTDEEMDTEKTPEEVSASCVRKLNRLEILLKHKLKEDRTVRMEMKKTKQSLSDQKMENEMLKIRLQSLQQHQTNKTSDQKEEEEESSSPPQQDWTANKKSTSTYFENDSSSMAGSPTASNAKVLETLSQQYEDMLRNKETEISKLREDLKKAIRGNNSIDSVRRLQPGQAAREEVLALQERLDKVSEEKEVVETKRDELNREMIRLRAELTSKIDSLTCQLSRLEGERSEWRERMAEMEKELEMVREMTEEKMQDMAVALVVAHDFQVEESERRKRVEKELENARSELSQLESECKLQRTESESMKRDLESEREAHRMELTSYQKQTEELSTNMNKLKKQLGGGSTPPTAAMGQTTGILNSNSNSNPTANTTTTTAAATAAVETTKPISTNNSKTVGLSNKPVQINPKSPTGREKPAKFIRMSSLMEPVSPSPMSPSLFKTATDFDADVDDDCVDNAPIIKNVRSMVENFESPSGSPLSAIETAPAAKHRRYSGAQRNEKRRAVLQSSHSVDERLSEVAKDANLKELEDNESILNKVSSAIKNINEKCEATETPKSSGHSKPRPMRSQISALELSTKAYRSPLNKLKINDIVVSRGSMPRQKVSDPMLKPGVVAGGSNSTSSAASSDSENLQPGVVSGTTSAGHSAATLTTTVIASPVTNSSSPTTHVLTATLPSSTRSGANASSPLVTTFTTAAGVISGDSVGCLGNNSSCGENDALKQLMQKGSHVSVRNALLDWCKEVTKVFAGVEVTNFSSSWTDGLAFCALFYSCATTTHLKQFPQFSSLVRQASKRQNFEVAQKLATSIGIKFDLDVEKIIANERPDWKLILPVVKAIFEGISVLNSPAQSQP